MDGNKDKINEHNLYEVIEKFYPMISKLCNKNGVNEVLTGLGITIQLIYRLNSIDPKEGRKAFSGYLKYLENLNESAYVSFLEKEIRSKNQLDD